MARILLGWEKEWPGEEAAWELADVQLAYYRLLQPNRNLRDRGARSGLALEREKLLQAATAGHTSTQIVAHSDKAVDQ